VSTFGFLNLGLMTAPRVYYAMAQDGRSSAPVHGLLAVEREREQRLRGG